MAASKPFSEPELLHLPGTTLEGGGQLIRIALGLSALTRIPLRISAIRGNRPRGGGLKAQHLASLNWLAQACGAKVKGDFLASRDVEFFPGCMKGVLGKEKIINGKPVVCIEVSAGGMGSVSLVLQAILPYILFGAPLSNTKASSGSAASSPKAKRRSVERSEQIVLIITGGTNVSFSPSYEYVSQVLLPTLERIGIPRITSHLHQRGWSIGPQSRHGQYQEAEVGKVSFTIQPLPSGTPLANFNLNGGTGKLRKLEVSMIAEIRLRCTIKEKLRDELRTRYPALKWEEDVNFKIDEDSGHGKRIYLLLVAITDEGHRLGFDALGFKKRQWVPEFVQGVIWKMTNALRNGAAVDEHMSDQLVVYQALANGRSFVDSKVDDGKADEGIKPTLHTQTARWVAEKVLGVEFNHLGVCEGSGLQRGKPFHKEAQPRIAATSENHDELQPHEEPCIRTEQAGFISAIGGSLYELQRHEEAYTGTAQAEEVEKTEYVCMLDQKDRMRLEAKWENMVAVAPNDYEHDPEYFVSLFEELMAPGYITYARGEWLVERIKQHIIGNQMPLSKGTLMESVEAYCAIKARYTVLKLYDRVWEGANYHRKIVLNNTYSTFGDEKPGRADDPWFPVRNTESVTVSASWADEHTHWIVFEHEQNGVKLAYTIRCDLEEIDLSDLTGVVKTEWCAYPLAYCAENEYCGNRFEYETECNNIGWALASLNPCLRGSRVLILKAVVAWQKEQENLLLEKVSAAAGDAQRSLLSQQQRELVPSGQEKQDQASNKAAEVDSADDEVLVDNSDDEWEVVDGLKDLKV